MLVSLAYAACINVPEIGVQALYLTACSVSIRADSAVMSIIKCIFMRAILLVCAGPAVSPVGGGAQGGS